MTMPPMHTVTWLQYLAIVCASEKLDQEAHNIVVQEAAKFLMLWQKCTVSCFPGEKLPNMELLPMNTYVVIFFCIRSFFLHHAKASDMAISNCKGYRLIRPFHLVYNSCDRDITINEYYKCSQCSTGENHFDICIRCYKQHFHKEHNHHIVSHKEPSQGYLDLLQQGLDNYEKC